LREPTTFGVSVCSAKLGPIGSGFMRVAFRRLLAVLLVAAGLLGGTGITAPTAGALGWGAIAISPTTGRVGYSQGLNSAIEAEQAAVGLCKSRDCRAVVNFTKACGAVAQSIQHVLGMGLGPRQHRRAEQGTNLMQSIRRRLPRRWLDM
jgi:hypothetical protein